MITACVAPEPYTGIIRVCDSSGCSDRPSYLATYNSSTATPDQDPDERMVALMRLAQKDAYAAYDLGLRFFRGDGVRQDSYRALQWMRDAAERGNLGAQKAVGKLYLTGLEEMGSDSREALKWLSIAAGRGDQEAKELLSEASRLRTIDNEYYRWRNQWRSVFYDRWSSGYRYQSRWNNGVWNRY